MLPISRPGGRGAAAALALETLAGDRNREDSRCHWSRRTGRQDLLVLLVKACL